MANVSGGPGYILNPPPPCGTLVRKGVHCMYIVQFCTLYRILNPQLGEFTWKNAPLVSPTIELGHSIVP